MSDIYEIIDPAFGKLVFGNARMDTIWTGGRWAEGPAYLAAGRYLIWSDIPNDRVMRWDEINGQTSTFLQPALNHNGHTVDHEGRLICCEHRGRAVTRIEHDGSRTVLADRWQGKRFNSPNDVVVKSDGSIWFSDPSYGIDSDYEGDHSPSEIGKRQVYRIDPSGSVDVVIDDMVQPNGIAFSPDETLLYIADTGKTHDPKCVPAIRVYPVNKDGKSVGKGKQLCKSTSGLFDGFRIDTAGRIWTSAGDGVHCFSPEGKLLGKILTGEVVANLVFGGPKRNRLFICATTSVRAVYVNAQGCSYFPKPAV